MIVSGLLAPATRRRDPGTGANLAHELLAWDRRALITSVRSVLVERTAVLDALDDLQTPTLVVSGTEDRTLPTIHSQRLVDKLPDGRLVEVPEAAHLVPLEQPEAANAITLDFLGQNPPN